MEFTNVVKPTHLCNLGCTYCYNDDVRDPIMKDETLERTIKETLDYVNERKPIKQVHFIWHGGEPMIPGIKFYEKVVKLQEQYRGEAKILNSIQTNGVLINEKWLHFLKQHQFNISISIDGTKELHDRFRLDLRGRGTFDRVIKAIDLCLKHDLPPGACVVISRANIDHVEEIYQFLAEKRIGFNIIPLCRSGAARENYDDLGLDSEEYGDAWIRMYDLWFDTPPEQFTYIHDFVLKTRAIMYGKEADCIGMASCSHTNISTDPVGDIFACATLSGHDDTRYGNLVTDPLESLMRSTTALNYRLREVDPDCAKCKWQHVCHGGCPARSYKFFQNHHQRDYYCPSLFKIYDHIENRLAEKGVAPALPHPDHMTDGLDFMVEEAAQASRRVTLRIV